MLVKKYVLFVLTYQTNGLLLLVQFYSFTNITKNFVYSLDKLSYPSYTVSAYILIEKIQIMLVVIM